MILTKIFKTIRSADWWEHKIPPLLAIGYATALRSETPLIQIAPSLLFLLMAVAVGAIYVSAINDITDLKEDIQSGKSNRIEKVKPKYRWTIPIISLILGVFFFYSFLPDRLSALLYLLPWISFSLYSFEPFRLKQKGIWGVIADASGAHLFITLLMISCISYVSNQTIDSVWFLLVGVWSFCFGLRGILWHQYFDRSNDLKINANTFATNFSPDQFRKYENIIIFLELLAFSGVLINISLPILYIFGFLYLVIVLLRFNVLRYRCVVVLNPVNCKFQILMLDFYQVLLPYGLLLYGAFTQKHGWILLFVHSVLFPKKITNLMKDLLIIVKTVVRTKVTEKQSTDNTG